METDVVNIKNNLNRIEGAQTRHFSVGVSAVSAVILILTAITISFSIYFSILNRRFVAAEERTSVLVKTAERIDERLKAIEKRVEQIPTEKEMIGIMHQVLDSREQCK